MQVMTSKLSSKHQVVVPAVARRALGLKAGDRLVWEIGKNEVKVQMGKKNWASYTRGLGKEAWKGVDPVEYINKLRDEWQR